MLLYTNTLQEQVRLKCIAITARRNALYAAHGLIQIDPVTACVAGRMATDAYVCFCYLNGINPWA